MKWLKEIQVKDVQAVYSGPEGDLWELLMGEQIHIGGFESSMDLAKKAGIQPGWTGVDLCSCTGAGMRFLVRFCGTAKMTGIDITPKSVDNGRVRVAAEGLSSQIEFVLGDASDTKLPAGSVDFVWSEDCICYVADKDKTMAEAVRLVKKGGIIAFTDWCEGTEMSEAETKRFLGFMKFPTFATIRDYTAALEKQGCEILVAENTGRYEPCIGLYEMMVGKQLTFDALKKIGWNLEMLQAIGGEMGFIHDLARDGKVIQALIVARKK
jgi:ubiquinone/menaquinone biosynthesis C-methylase UbiE